VSVSLETDFNIAPYIVRCIDEEEIPIVDVGGYLNGDLGAREQLAIDLRAIQESLGFFIIVNHGVSQDLIDSSFEQVARLFALPLKTKMKYQVGYHHIGYIPDRASSVRPHDVKISESHKNHKKT
jgi:isopenicillin N synthase-like dioxygenase